MALQAGPLATGNVTALNATSLPNSVGVTLGAMLNSTATGLRRCVLRASTGVAGLGRLAVRASVAALVIVASAWCAPPAARTPGDGAQPPQELESAALTWLLSDEVLVLPTHEATVGEPGATTPSENARVAAQFDSVLRELLQPHVARGWIWPTDLRALHRRNPLNVPDPTRLPTAGLRGARLRSEAQLSPELGSQIRALTAVSGARRYVLLPIHLHVGQTSRGGQVAGVTLVAIDARRAVVLQTRSLATGTASANPGAPDPSRNGTLGAFVRDLARLSVAEFVSAAQR
jgi:hypothetical protein